MKHIAVIGLGAFGSRVAINLTQKGFDVLAIDIKADIVSEIKDLVEHAVCVDCTDENAARAVSVDTVDVALVAIGSNVQSSLLTVALLQKLGIQDIYVRSISELQEGILKSMGILSENILNIEEEMGDQISSILATGKVGRYIQISERHSLMEINIPKHFVGKSLKGLDLRLKHKINVVGIKKLEPEVDDMGEMNYRVEMKDVPDPDAPLEESDVLVVLGTDENVQKFAKLGEAYD